MSYIDNKLAFASAEAIQELSFDQIDEVSGGHPMLVVLAVVGAVALGYLACDYIVKHC